MIKVGLVGIGNCASSLVQGIAYCRAKDGNAIGLPFPTLGNYTPSDIEIVCAFDVDSRKVGKNLSEAIFSPPNCTSVFWPTVSNGTQVSRGPVLDGVSALMRNQSADRGFTTAVGPEPKQADIISILRKAEVDVVVNFLPVGSQLASEFYAECALQAGCAFVNGIPVFLASNSHWSSRFASAGLPILGDDIKAQLGATIFHRALARLFDMRGGKLDRSYQLNIGGNTDFLNMTDHDRLLSKRESKTASVQSNIREPLDTENIRVGPSDYVPWLNDQKIGYIRLEGRLFGGVPMSVEVRLSVEDSPNSAAMALIAIRCAKIARDRRIGGAVAEASAFLFKHPPRQVGDEEALLMLEQFAAEKIRVIERERFAGVGA
jgi:myo-inositol-1-phosphate synthase